MKLTLLTHLTCPKCGCYEPNLKIEIKEQNGDIIDEGYLFCPKNHRFKISQGIPDFVDEADTTGENSHLYDTLWELHDAKDYRGKREEYKIKFQKSAKLPGSLEAYFQDKIILDAGCGEGRFTYLAAELGAKQVIAIDYSAYALRRARIQTGNPDNVEFVRANIEALPLRRTFDYVFSFGVLHHTPNTKKSFDNVAACLKDGGWMTVYVYSKWSLPLIQWPLRPLTLRLPKHWVSKFCDTFGFSYRSEIRPLISLSRLFKRLGRWDILGVSRITFEGLTTPYLWEHTRKEVCDWFIQKGFTVISSSNEVAVSGHLNETNNRKK